MPPPADRPSPPSLRLRGFRILPENRSAVKAVRLVARSVLAGLPVPVCPVMLHGPPGSGKSRLVSTALAELLAAPTGLTARCESAGDLARSSGETPTDFHDPELRHCDLLVVEDLQHLPERAAGVLAELLDYRARRRRAVLLTATVGPAGLAHLPQRLTSRLAAGLVVAVAPPGPAGRRAILADAAEAKGLRLTPDGLDLLVDQGGSLRATLGLLQGLSQLAARFPSPLDRSAVAAVLHGSGQPTCRGPQVGVIIGRVAAAFGINNRDLLGDSRLRTIRLARQVAMYLVRELTGLSLPRIGSTFRRDHSTVLHACRKIGSELASDPVLAARVRSLKEELGMLGAGAPVVENPARGRRASAGERRATDPLREC